MGDQPDNAAVSVPEAATRGSVQMDWGFAAAVAGSSYSEEDDLRSSALAFAQQRTRMPLFEKLEALIGKYPETPYILCETYSPNEATYEFELLLEQGQTKDRASALIGRKNEVTHISLAPKVFADVWSEAEDLELVSTGGNLEIGSRIADGFYMFYTFRRAGESWQNLCYSPLVRIPYDDAEWHDLFQKTNKYQRLQAMIFKVGQAEQK